MFTHICALAVAIILFMEIFLLHSDFVSLCSLHKNKRTSLLLVKSMLLSHCFATIFSTGCMMKNGSFFYLKRFSYLPGEYTHGLFQSQCFYKFALRFLQIKWDMLPTCAYFNARVVMCKVWGSELGLAVCHICNGFIQFFS